MEALALGEEENTNREERENINANAGESREAVEKNESDLQRLQKKIERNLDVFVWTRALNLTSEFVSLVLAVPPLPPIKSSLFSLLVVTQASITTVVGVFTLFSI